MQVIILLLVAGVIVATYLPLVRKDDWWIRVFDFPRLQILFLGVLGVIALLAYGAWGTVASGLLLAALVSALVIQCYRIYPYTPLAATEVMVAGEPPSGAVLSLFVVNVLMRNRKADRLLSLIRQHRPDVVLMLEPDDWWEGQVRALADTYPYSVKEPRDNRYGMLLYSRLPLLEPETKYLVRDAIPSIHARVRLDSGTNVSLHCIHPEPPSPTEADTSTPRDAELLIVGRHVRDREEPTIVTGDLNDVAWSRTTELFQKISGLLDPRKGRGMFNTFHAGNPLLRWPLDHVFHSNHFSLKELRRLPAFGSDHFPFYVRLVLDPNARRQQRQPAADADDQAAASAKISRAAEH